MNTNNRNLHQEIHELIENRPLSFGHLLFQQIFRGFFIVAGLLTLTGAVLATTYHKLSETLVRSSIKDFENTYPVQVPSVLIESLVNKINPITYIAIGLIWIIAFFFFVSARYARKTIKRNQYILQLEEIIKSSRMYNAVNNPAAENTGNAENKANKTT